MKKRILKLIPTVLTVIILMQNISVSFAQDSAITVSAKAAILMEKEPGEILYEMNAKERRAAGSVTKLMSILLFMEAIDQGLYTLDDIVTVSEFAN